MEVLERGKYSGSVANMYGTDGVIICVTTYHTHHFNGAVHYHDDAHISFAVEGGCIEKKKEPYEISSGAITYYSAGEQHQVLKVVKPSRRINLELEQRFFDEYDISDNMIRKAILKNPDARFLMIKIYNEIVKTDNFSSIAIHHLLLQLIHQPGSWYSSTRLPAWISIVDQFLRDNMDESPTLHQLSLVANVHPVTISKQFPRYFGCTLGEYIRKIRIEKAVALIKSPGYSLTDVAYACGFFDQSHFIRTFKQLTGFLPSSYQKS